LRSTKGSGVISECDYLKKTPGPFISLSRSLSLESIRGAGIEPVLAAVPKEPLQGALRADSQLFPAVFQALRKIDTDAFIREGRVYGGGL
jgi:hypothetical protein